MHFEGRIDLQNAPVFIIRGYGTTSIRTLICLHIFFYKKPDYKKPVLKFFWT